VERLRIGELLVQAKLITPERLETALALQRAQGRKLGQVLIDLGIVNETQLTQALGQQLSVPWVSLYHIEFSRSLLDLVPREIAERFCLVPIFVRRVRKKGETLYVAMDDPTNEVALEAVRAASSLPVRAMIAAPSDIRGAIRVYYETGEPEPGPVLPAQPPGAPATVRSQALGGPTPPPPPPPQAPEAEAARPAPPAPPPPVTPAPPAPPRDPRIDSPEASPELEAHEVDVPRRKSVPNLFALTLLDGTTLQIPKPRRGHDDSTRRDEESGPEPPSGPHALSKMTTRDLVKSLRAVAAGTDPVQVFGEKAPVEAICATLLSLLMRKGLIADWEFVEELRRTK
jgi:type IV pilus assembly protein PilB